MDIIDTGERILLEKETPQMIARHLCAYKFAKDYVIDKSILDIGCGEGYGSYYLSEAAREVTGIDYDRAIIDYAKDKYKRNNLEFIMVDIKSLGSMADKFGVICSFQVIEHILDVERFLKDVKYLLTDEGIFICSTPNRLDASPKSSISLNKFYVKEYLADDFKVLLQQYFAHVDMFGLKRGRAFNFYRRLKKIGLFNFLPDSTDPAKKFYGRIDCSDFIIVKDKFNTALDFIAGCSKQSFSFNE